MHTSDYILTHSHKNNKYLLDININIKT